MVDLETEVFSVKKHVVAELAERTALLRSFIDASPDDLLPKRKGEFSGCNRAMEELTGKRK